jgi:hypothetical protein
MPGILGMPGNQWNASVRKMASSVCNTGYYVVLVVRNRRKGKGKKGKKERKREKKREKEKENLKREKGRLLLFVKI